MKNKPYLLATFITFTLFTWHPTYAGPHDHDAHDHENPESEHGHPEHGDEKAEAGPNGGRIITSVEPHFEFYLTAERKVQITFLNDESEVIAPKEQVVSLIGGDRQNPARLRFVSQGSTLVSDQALPEGNNLPIILSIKPDSKSKTVRERFNLNLSSCPTCKYKEYACICAHGEAGHEGHDH